MVNFGGARARCGGGQRCRSVRRLLLRLDRRADQRCAKGGGCYVAATWGQPRRLAGHFGPAPALPGTMCGSKRAVHAVRRIWLAENGNHATYNQVVPKFFSASLTDEFRPTDKWLFNLGVRLDSFTFNGSNTDYGAARNFWTNAFNIDNCVNNVSGQPTSKTGLGIDNPTAVSGGLLDGVLPERLRRTSRTTSGSRVSSGTYTVNPQTSYASRTAVIRKLRTRRSSSTTRCKKIWPTTSARTSTPSAARRRVTRSRRRPRSTTTSRGNISSTARTCRSS